MMNSRERILAVVDGTGPDRVPLTTWCFGLVAPRGLRWSLGGVERRFWYSLRMEHIHTWLQPWGLEDDFQRVLAWRSLGVDDLLDVSVPWSVDPRVTWTDSEEPAGVLDPQYPVMVRQYETPAGSLRHAVRRTGEDPGAGWVIQPRHVPLFEDLNIPRAVEHAVSSPRDVPAVRHLYAPPDAAARDWFAGRMAAVRAFAGREGVAVQAWAGFGMDAVVWLAGTQGAVLMAMDEPDAFAQLIDLVIETDLARIELAAATPGVDIVVERGWYSSTDFWSPRLFDRFLFSRIARLADAVHRHGKRFAYVMTTGVERLGPRLAEAGVDLLYFVDPVQDRCSLEAVRDTLAGRMALVGGVNAVSLHAGDPERIRREVRHALEVLGPTGRFILHPLDALFPDTPWQAVLAMIEAWKELT